MANASANQSAGPSVDTAAADKNAAQQKAANDAAAKATAPEADPIHPALAAGHDVADANRYEMPGDEYVEGLPGSATHTNVPLGQPAGEETIVYPAEGKQQETARALLDAADDPADVRWAGDGFLVPSDVADRANVPEADEVEPSGAHSS